LSGTTYTWTGAQGNDWNLATNWTVGAAVSTTAPNATTATAIDDLGTVPAILSNATAFVQDLNVGGVGHVIIGGGPAIGGAGTGTLVATTIEVTSTNDGGGLVGGTNSTIDAQTLTLGAGAIIGGGGVFNIATLNNSGIIQADGGNYNLGGLVVTGGNIVGAGSIEVDGSSAFELGSATAQTILVNVAAAQTASLLLDNPGSFTGTLNLFNADTHLDLYLKGEAPTGATFDDASRNLIITGAAGTIETIPFVSNGSVAFTASPTSNLAGYGLISIGPTGTTPTGGLTVTDTTSGQPVTATGTAYSGPVPGIQNEYVSVSQDNLNITTSTPNWFIHSGSGTDAIDVSKGGGTNVLDGSTGSNFLTGGTGNDTFFLDDRAPTADVFSTVVGFHSGDNATVFGVDATNFTVQMLDNQGAAGFTGLDFSFTAPGHQNANIVLTGYTTADLTNGRLTTSYGTTPDAPGAPAANYLLIHAN
jgi:hypothetical protein